MCLRCQMYFDSQPRTQKRCSTPMFIIRGWFPLFQVPICKILMYTNQSWFPFIFRKEQQREEFSATVQTGHESCRCGTARPSGDYVGLPRAKPRDGTMSRGGHCKGGQWVSSHRRCRVDRNNPNKRGEANRHGVNQQVALHQGRRTRRRVVTKHQPGTTLRFARQCVCSRWRKYGQHSSMLAKYNKIHSLLQAI